MTAARSVAFFVKDKLRVCADITFSGLARPALLQEHLEREVSKMTKSGDDKTRVVPLRRACADQFDDRPALASCTTQPQVGDGGTGEAATMRNFYYEGVDDALMKECLEARGDWINNGKK